MSDSDHRVVHPDWIVWVAENLGRGASAHDITDGLVQEGIGLEDARRCVEEVSASPMLSLVERHRRRSDALELMLRLRHVHRRQQLGGCTEIVRKPLPPPAEFLAQHWVPGVPAVFTDVVTKWAAWGRWSPHDLAERFGDVVVKVSVGRDAVADPDADWQDIERSMPLRAVIDRILGSQGSNDVYVIAKNDLFRQPGLQGLLEDLSLDPSYFGEERDPTRMALWLGPAGTHTPLHHDGDNAMLCQMVGRKRVRLAPPESIPLLDVSRGVYSRFDPNTDAELARGPERLIELCLAPGEALFLPAGWWHQVDALEVSMTVSIRTFAWPNDLSWYKPGSVLRGTTPPPRLPHPLDPGSD